MKPTRRSRERALARRSSALVLVDVQNDFLPTGALPVPHGDEVIAIANALVADFEGLIVATWDWHPPDHGSFASNHPGKRPHDIVELGGVPQVLWPDHCVQYSYGARFPAPLDVRRVERVVVKGTDPAIDSYSGFFDNGRRKATELGPLLRQRGIREILLMGLATDYCVKATAIDARTLGFSCTLIVDGCRGVDVQPGDAERAIVEMRSAGVKTAWFGTR